MTCRIFIVLSLIHLSGCEEIFVPKLIEPPRIIFRKLYPDPNNCHQMTWDADWDKMNPSVCRGSSCFRPYYDGPTQPDPKNFTRSCGLTKGESCIKHVIFDQFDLKKPVFVTRYCGYFPIVNTGKRLTNTCIKAIQQGRNVEICACRDKNMCNSSTDIKTNRLVLVALFVNVFFVLLF
jgi:hypothetical protein